MSALPLAALTLTLLTLPIAAAEPCWDLPGHCTPLDPDDPLGRTSQIVCSGSNGARELAEEGLSGVVCPP